MPQEDDDLAANYVGAFDGRLSFGKRPALLIVDFVMAYLDKSSPLYAHVEDALESNIRLLAAARAAGIPVIFTNVVYEKDGADGGLFYKKIPSLRVFVKGSPYGAFPPSLQPLDGERIISKQFASAFLELRLRTSSRPRPSIRCLSLACRRRGVCAQPHWMRSSRALHPLLFVMPVATAIRRRMTQIYSIFRPNMQRSSRKAKQLSFCAAARCHHRKLKIKVFCAIFFYRCQSMI